MEFRAAGVLPRLCKAVLSMLQLASTRVYAHAHLGKCAEAGWIAQKVLSFERISKKKHELAAPLQLQARTQGKSVQCIAPDASRVEEDGMSPARRRAKPRRRRRIF